MNIIDAAKRTVLAFPGSYAGMGAALGMSPNVLRNKVSRSNDTHHLTVVEAMEIVDQAATANVPDPYAILRAMAAEFGFQLVREGQGAGPSDMSLAEKLLRTQQTSSELSLAVIAAVADGEIDEDELALISSRRQAAAQEGVELEEMVRHYATPTPLRAVG
jgi:uncharacterized membrane protein YebE (DUF533 family)